MTALRLAAADLGASSVKVVAGTLDGHRLTTREVAHAPNTPVRIGERLYWDFPAIFGAIVAGFRQAADDAALDAVAIDSWGVDYGLIADDGEMLGLPVHYRDDRGARGQRLVEQHLPFDELYRATGIQRQPFNTIYQLAASADSSLLAAARRLLLMPDLIGYLLTGIEGCEVTNASTTAMLDLTGRGWEPRALKAAGITPDLLAPLREAGTIAGPLLDPIAREIDSPNCSLAIVGSHDTASAVAAIPTLSPETAAFISCGTWSLAGIEVPSPIVSDQARAANFTNERAVGGSVRFLRNVMGMWLLNESLRHWRDHGLDVELLPLLAQARHEPALLTVIDAQDEVFFAPGDIPARIAQQARQSGQPVPQTPAAIVRCILDSLALAHRRALRTASELAGRKIEQVHLMGGPAKNELLAQLTADATGLPVHAGPVDASALGSLIVQAQALGAFPGGLGEARAMLAGQGLTRTYQPSSTSRRWEVAERLIDDFAAATRANPVTTTARGDKSGKE